MVTVVILAVSDTCAQKKREDVSGQTIAAMLDAKKFDISARRIVPDDHDTIVSELEHFSDDVGVEVVLTTGGTGLGPRDVTPEATASVCERMVPGLGEVMRAESLKHTPNAVLSRGVAGIRKNTLIINLPGSPKAVRECLEIILDILGHAVDMMRGGGH